MFDSKIVSEHAGDTDFEQRLYLIHNLLATLSALASSAHRDAALQEVSTAGFPPLCARYARAGGVARRRASALLEEAGLEGGAGIRLMTRRGSIARLGDAAAASFLYRRLGHALNRVDRLLPAA